MNTPDPQTATPAGELLLKQGDQALLAEMSGDYRLSSEKRAMCQRLAAFRLAHAKEQAVGVDAVALDVLSTPNSHDLAAAVALLRSQGYSVLAGAVEALAPPASSVPDSAQLVEALGKSLTEVVAAMRKYEMDVDADAPAAHREMMRRADQALDTLSATNAQPDSAHTPSEAWPEKLTPELQAILGFMCFQLGGPAQLYRKAGEFIGSEGELKGRAEDEQAFMLHKLLGFWFKHGSAWKEAAQADLDRAKAALAPNADQGRGKL